MMDASYLNVTKKYIILSKQIKKALLRYLNIFRSYGKTFEEIDLFSRKSTNLSPLLFVLFDQDCTIVLSCFQDLFIYSLCLVTFHIPCCVMYKSYVCIHVCMFSLFYLLKLSNESERYLKKQS